LTFAKVARSPSTSRTADVCGIVGIRRFDGAPVDPGLLRAMTSRLIHRGPDADGYWIDGPIGFGHRRLSIIDLSGSVQPMASVDDTCRITFNGEILNYGSLRQRVDYPYRTHGDTETILACYQAHGEAFLGDLEGQFAFALHDNRDDSLLLARDRMGILPLYYYVDSTLFAFASEVKALLPALADVQVDTHSLDAYLATRAVPAPYTLFKGIRKLPPAHTLRVGDRGLERQQRYWSMPQALATEPPNAEEAVGELASKLRSAVAAALVADVPVGAYLSGGLDSSLIVALMCELRGGGKGVKTFSAGFGDPRHDELPYARQVSELLNTEHHEVVVGTQDFQELWRKLTWHRDAPISEPADVAVFKLAELARRSVRVVLSGEGSDELFAGYPKHRYAGLTAAIGIVPDALRSPLFDALQSVAPPSASRLRIAARALSGRNQSERMRNWFAPFTRSERLGLLQDTASHPSPDWLQQPDGDALRQMMMLDAQTWLPDNLLERGDRMSMAASLELRPPFLDRHVVDFAFGLPSSLKLRQRKTKWLVKQVASRHLPHTIVDRHKVGFRVPLDAWFRDGLEAFAWDTLTSKHSLVSRVMDRGAVRKLLDRHRAGRSNEEMRIWTLLCLEVWYQTFIART
jgi:asparagine synthase (glutamine-hydrolysing)